jgi:hypothetical protein
MPDPRTFPAWVLGIRRYDTVNYGLAGGMLNGWRHIRHALDTGQVHADQSIWRNRHEHRKRACAVTERTLTEVPRAAVAEGRVGFG